MDIETLNAIDDLLNELDCHGKGYTVISKHEHRKGIEGLHKLRNTTTQQGD